jgi:hypothetical protein
MTLPAGWTPAGRTPTNEQATLGNEQTLWKNQLTEGIFKKRVVEVQTITNYRVVKNDWSVMFRDIDDVVVMNQNRVSQSNYMGTYYGNMLGNILIILKGSFLVRSIKGTFVTYYDIPLREIKQILGNCVTLHPFKNEILQKYMKSTKRIWEE